MKLTDSPDGAHGIIVVFDLIEGLSEEEEKVLRQALEAGLQPSIFVDKLDKAMEMMDPEAVFQACVRGLEQVNVVLGSYCRTTDLTCYPDGKGPEWPSAVLRRAGASRCATSPRSTPSCMACPITRCAADSGATTSSGQTGRSGSLISNQKVV